MFIYVQIFTNVEKINLAIKAAEYKKNKTNKQVTADNLDDVFLTHSKPSKVSTK